VGRRKFFLSLVLVCGSWHAPEGLAKTAKGKGSVSTASAAAADAERDFARAEDLFKQGQEDSAIVSLSDFLRRYPGHARADDSQYLIGEIEFRRRNFENAIRELKKTLDYRKQGGDRVADAYYLVGESLLRLGQTERARIEWEALRRAYPNSPAADRAALKLMEVSK